jgi:hypothetical protein
MTFSDEDWKIHKTLNKIYENHFLANDVRHRFETKSPEEAQTTVNCFLAFAKAENWGRLQALEEIKKELENWDSRSPYQSPELTKAIKEIEQLKKENENVENNIFQSIHNVQLDTLAEYKQNGTRHSFLDKFSDGDIL